MTAATGASTAPRVALVTGAGQRVGRAIAVELAARGWQLAVHYHASVQGAAETVAAIERAGGAASAFQADLREPEACAALVSAVAARFGALDALVNSAAGMERSPIGETTAAQFDAIIALNLRAPFLLSQAAAASFRDGGVIVNIADHMAEEPWPGYAVHGISKAGVIALTRHLAAALAPKIRVNAVAPGFVLPPPDMPREVADRLIAETLLQRAGTPHDVAAAVVYLLGADFVTGETLHVDGGRRVRR